MNIIANITPIAAFMTVLSHVGLSILLLALFHKSLRKYIYFYVEKYIVELLFISSLAALVGSLVYSNIVKFPPCELCWIQRMFMYPQTVLLLVALIKKERSIIPYLFIMSIIGAIVGVYHSLIHWGFNFVSVLGCTAVGGECAKVYVNEFGYITIPVMSLTVYIYLIVFTLIYYYARRSKEFK